MTNTNPAIKVISSLSVEEKGLVNQIQRLKDLVPTKDDADRDDFIYTAKYLQERLTEVIEDLETIKDCIKSENDRILKYTLTTSVDFFKPNTTITNNGS